MRREPGTARRPKDAFGKYLTNLDTSDSPRPIPCFARFVPQAELLQKSFDTHGAAPTVLALKSPAEAGLLAWCLLREACCVSRVTAAKQPYTPHLKKSRFSFK